MSSVNDPRQTLHQIQDMMLRSSRYVSLSGWSAVAAGLCALLGALAAWYQMKHAGSYFAPDYKLYEPTGLSIQYSKGLGARLIITGFITLLAALASASFFTYRRTKRLGSPFWSMTAQRLMLAMAIPMAAGGLFLLKLYTLGITGLVGPGCLIFYGLALVSAAQHSYGMFRWLGLAQIVLGLISMHFLGMSLAFWALGFGVLHIGFGLWMVWKLERA